MKFSTTFIKLGLALLCAFLAIGCTETDDSMDNRDLGYGFVQFKLYKKATRAADELEYLRDAHKITLTLVKDNQTINQTVLVEQADASISEFGLRTEKLKLMVGGYRLSGYVIYNSVDERILTGAPDNTLDIAVEQSKLLVQRLEIKTVLRGHFQFRLTKGLPAIKPQATRAGAETQDFTFDQIAKADLTFRNQETGRSFSVNNIKVKYVRDDQGSSYLKSDSLIEAQAAKYQLERYEVWDNSNKPLSTVDCRDQKIYYTVEDNKVCKADIKVPISPTALYILDYMALKKIYDDMNGENWSWKNDGFPEGGKWNFDKDIDLWYEQPGVSIHPNGRVAALNLGALNPSGPISPALGQLTALVELWLGTHNDLSRDETGSGAVYDSKYYSTWSRHLKGQHLPEYRWELYKEEMLARNPQRMPSEIFTANKMKPEAEALWNSRTKPGAFNRKPVAARPYADVMPGDYTNHLTSIPDEIGNLVNLEVIFIANGEIATIPESIKNCVSLTDVEVYNCPKMVTFPMALALLPEMVSLNIAVNTQMPAAEIEKGLDAIFSGPSKDKLQILYANNNNIEVFPESAKNLKKIGLLDLANNKIRKIYPMTSDVSPVQFFLNNNRLTSLPKNLCNWDDIEAFSIADNQLTELPNIFTINTDFYIGSLDFSYNRIKGIAGYDMNTMELTPDQDGELFRGIKATTLNLTGNMLSGGFPAAFSLSKSDISRYNLCYNNLDSIGAKGLKGLKFTTALDLSSNNIEVAPRLEDILIGQEMPFLTGIDLSYNHFKEFPTTLFNGYGITTFFFSSQIGVKDDTTYRCFTKWPDGIEQYAGLKVLKVDGNDLRVIKTFPTVLNYLAIDNNPNISLTIPSDICARIVSGSFGFVYDTTQTGIKGCTQLGIE